MLSLSVRPIRGFKMNNEQPKHENSPPSLALRPKEAAKALGISERLLWTKTNMGDIPHVRIGRRVVYPVSSLEEWPTAALPLSARAGDLLVTRVDASGPAAEAGLRPLDVVSPAEVEKILGTTAATSVKVRRGDGRFCFGKVRGRRLRTQIARDGPRQSTNRRGQGVVLFR